MVFNVLSVTRVTFLPAFANHVKFVAGLAFVELGNAINLIKTFPGQLAGLLVHLDVGNSLSINCTPPPHPLLPHPMPSIPMLPQKLTARSLISHVHTAWSSRVFPAGKPFCPLSSSQNPLLFCLFQSFICSGSSLGCRPETGT